VEWSGVEKMACVSFATPRGRDSAIDQYSVVYIPHTDLHITNVAKPVLEWRRRILPFHRSPNATAVIVTTDDNVGDFENIHRELQSSHQIKVCRDDQIGNVTNYKDGSALLSHDLISRDTSIGAA
jgi:hypothetical protein